MTKYDPDIRTTVAALALQGILAHPSNRPTAKVAAEQAVQYADALLERLKQEANQ